MCSSAALPCVVSVVSIHSITLTSIQRDINCVRAVYIYIYIYIYICVCMQ